MAINGQIVDEINGLIASRDSIRTTMKAATIASDTSKLADLATKLAAAKLGATTYNVSSSNQTIPAGKLTTGAQTIRAVTTSGIEAANIKSGTTITVGDDGSAGRIKNVAGTFTKEDNNPITEATVLSGKIGYVNGAKVTGNIPTVTPSATTLNCGSSAKIAKGYLASAVTITANSLASQTPGTAAAGDILSGKTAWVGGSKVTGSMPNGGVSVAAAGTLTKQPSISKQTINITGITDAAADNATTTAPTSSSTNKIWVKVKSAANTATYTPTATKTEGYISGGKVNGTAGTYGASESADTYIPIKNGAYSASVSTTAGSASMAANGVLTTTSATNYYITLSTTAGSATGKATVGTAGWVNKGSTSSSATSVNVSGNGTKLYLATYAPSTTVVPNNSPTTLATKGRVCTGDITISAVNYCYTSQNTPTPPEGNNGDIWLVVNP